MKPLVSILLPTFRRSLMLEQCVQSILRSADHPDAVEFCIRFQPDDPNLGRDMANMRVIGSNVRTMVGEKNHGYFGGHIHHTEAASMATGDWLWLMNDDSTVHGKGWDTRLADIPLDRIVLPRIHKLGESTYENDADCGAVIIPRGSITEFGWPPDKYALETLRALGLQTEFLDVTWHHHRESDEVRENHYGYKT